MNGELLGEFETHSGELAAYPFPVQGEPTALEIEVRFVNDYYEGPGKADRNLFVHGITISTLSGGS